MALRAEGADGTGTQSWTKQQRVPPWFCIKNHFYPRLYLRVIQHTHKEVALFIAVLQAACSSWQVISAFSSAPLTLIMQLNAALRIPTAAHPHYNTLPRSPTLSVSVTHTQTRVFLFFSLHDYILNYPWSKTTFFSMR